MDNTRTAVATFDLNVPVPPSAPQALSAVSGDALAIFRFEPPATDGGSPIVSYSIACNPGTSGASRNGAPITVAGLTNGLEYSCWATATNSAGTGAASAPITVNPTAAAFALLLVQSRKDHGAAGTFDLEIDADQPLGGDVSVEPRVIGAGHQIVFQFNASISIPGSATAVDASATPIGTVSATTSANEVIVTLTDVLDNQRLRVSLSGVNGSTSVAASIAFLLGDVRESRTVTASDILPAKARAGQAANAANFAHDVDLSGAIAANDLLTIKAASGRSLP